MFKGLMNFLKDIFLGKKPIVNKVPPKDDLPEQPTMEEVNNFPRSEIQKIAIIVGHGHGDSGAESWDKKTNEFEYNSIVASALALYPHSKQVKIFWRGSAGIMGVAAQVVLWKPDLSIELHLNSFNGEAKGCEVLCLKGDIESGKIGKDFAKKFTEKFNRTLRRDQGINWISSGDRGATSLRAVSPIKRSILIEPFFIDNKNEWIKPSDLAKHLGEWMRSI